MASDKFPEEVLLEIFKTLSLRELSRVREVCKRWNDIAQSDVLWKKFIPKCEHGEVEPGEALDTVRSMWYRSIEIGEERWYPKPLIELVRYESRLRKAEYHRFFRRNSNTTLYWRMNPCYEFTTNGNDVDDAKMNKVCREVWNQFQGSNEEPSSKITSHKTAMEHSSFHGRFGALERLLAELEPSWFLSGLELEPRKLDAEGNIKDLDPDEDDEEVPMDDLGDETSEEIFGPIGWDSNAWTSEVNKRLPVHLYCQLKALFADGCDDFIIYPLDDGNWNENLEYANSLMISDTAAFYIERYYEL